MVQKEEPKQGGCILKNQKTARLVIVFLGILLAAAAIMAGALTEISKKSAYANTTFVGVIQEISGQSIIVATYDEVGFTKAVIDLSAVMPYPIDLLPGEQLLIEILPQVSHETGIAKATAVSVDKLDSQASPDQASAITASGADGQDINGAVGIIDNEDASAIKQVVIPLPLMPYTAPTVDVFAASEDEISEVLASYIIDELIGQSAEPADVFIYKQTDGALCAAYRQDGKLYRFLTEEPTVYTDGFELTSYHDIFGYSGFVLTEPRGAAYIAHDYYYFDPAGNIKMLLQSSHPHFEYDLDGDGQKEIAYFYHGDWEMYCFFMKNEELYYVDITGAILDYGAEYPVTFEPPGNGRDVFTVHYTKDEEEITASLRIVDENIELTIENL